MKNLGEKIKGIFAKAGDEAAKVVDASGEKEETGKDGAGPGDVMPQWAKDMQAQLKKVTDSLMAQNPSSGQPGTYGDAEEEAKKKKDADDAAHKAAMDDAPPWAKDMVKVMNAMMEKMSGDAEKEEEESKDGEEEEESEDAEKEEDDDFEETPASKAGDEASRVEILAPGLKAKGKDAKRKALAKAYEAKDSKAIIERLNGGKAIDIKKASQKTIDHLFVGASEVIGLYRTKDFTKWKQVRDSEGEPGAKAGRTPEEINEANAKFYAQGAH